MGAKLDALFDQVKTLIEGGDGGKILLPPPDPRVCFTREIQERVMRDAASNGMYVYRYYRTLSMDAQWELIRELAEEFTSRPDPDPHSRVLINPSLGSGIEEHVKLILLAEWKKRPKPVLP